MKLSAIEVQALLNVEDDVIIAHGYTLDRRTLGIYFREGKVIRIEYKTDGRDEHTLLERIELDVFEPWLFTRNLKRWYLGGEHTPRKLNENLCTFFETFGDGLSTTAGGGYPEYPPF